MVMRTIRVTTLLLLCTTGSAKEEELSAGLKAKLEQMGADSMAKQVRTPRPHTPTTTTAKAHHHAPSHCRRVWVAWRASSVAISSSTRRHCMHTAHSLHARYTAAHSLHAHTAHTTHTASHIS